MSNFSPSDAALEGFRLTREQPTTILAWAGVYFAGIMILAAIMVLGIGREFIEFIRNGGLESRDTEALGALLASSAPAFMVALAAAVFLFSVLTAGIYRLVLRPSESGFAHLRLGGDEIRVAVVNVATIIIFMTFLLALDLIFHLGSNTEGVGAVAMLALGVATFVLMVWVLVRILIATPVAFSSRRVCFSREEFKELFQKHRRALPSLAIFGGIVLFLIAALGGPVMALVGLAAVAVVVAASFALAEAWILSRGKFWRLFGMVVMAAIFYVIVWVLVSIIAVLFITFAGGANAVQNLGDNPSPFAIAAFLVSFVIQLLLPILQAVMIYSPLALAYQQLTGPEPDAPEGPLPEAV